MARRRNVTKLLTLTTGIGAGGSRSRRGAGAAHRYDPHLHEPLFTSKDAWIAVGFVAGTVALYPADRYFARKLQSPDNQQNQFLSNAATTSGSWGRRDR